MGRVTFRARVVDQSRRLVKRGTVRSAIRQEFEGELAPRLVRIGRQTAPRRSGALGRGLRAVVGRSIAGVGVDVRSTVRSRQGYPYTGVTRFGHRQARIYPRHGRALSTPWGPRAWVRGYRPTHDWADDTNRAAQPEIARSAERIGRRLQGVL
jgi:hypothetical protein